MRLYPYYVVACLMLASGLSFLDRLVLALLIDPIRADLGLTDSEVSLLAGAAFATCYVGFAFAFGRWVDLRGRRNAFVAGIGQIGRGAGVVRVGQFGEILVVAVIFKKKNTS